METYLNIFADKSILLVEDDEVSQLLVEETLRKTGINLLKCSSSHEMDKILEQNPIIDLVLLDILLPDENGYCIAQRLRKKFPQLPIIAQTAYAMANDEQKCLDAGCSEYLTKPLKPEVLIDTLRKYLINN